MYYNLNFCCTQASRLNSSRDTLSLQQVLGRSYKQQPDPAQVPDEGERAEG